MYYGKKNKYRACKVELDGNVFDSRKEFSRYCELHQAQENGEISNLRTQVKYELIPKQKLEEPRLVNGKYQRNESAITYIADFVYEKDGKTIVEDVKSAQTRKLPTYVVKRKLMKYIHNIELREI